MARLACPPAASTTIMVSPMAREVASRKPPMMPGRAAGISTRRIVSDLLPPSASEPSRRERGTAFSASSDSDEMNGISMIPMTAPATTADFAPTSSARYSRWKAAGRNRSSSSHSSPLKKSLAKGMPERSANTP